MNSQHPNYTYTVHHIPSINRPNQTTTSTPGLRAGLFSHVGYDTFPCLRVQVLIGIDRRMRIPIWATLEYGWIKLWWATRATKINTTTVDGRNPANQLRLVVYPIIYRVLYIRDPRWCRISSINSIITRGGGNISGNCNDHIFEIPPPHSCWWQWGSDTKIKGIPSSFWGWQLTWGRHIFPQIMDKFLMDFNDGFQRYFFECQGYHVASWYWFKMMWSYHTCESWTYWEKLKRKWTHQPHPNNSNP